MRIINPIEMLNPTLFTTNIGNTYMYSFNKNYFLYIHPIIKYLYNQDKNFDNQNNSVNTVTETIDIHETYSVNEIKYYTKKYEFLKHSGFFSGINRNSYINGQITPSDVESELANLKTLVFEVTEKCNLNCAYCFYGDDYKAHDSRFNKNFDIKDAIALLKYLESKWISDKSISVSKQIHIGFYGGEPLMKFKFIESIVEYLKKIEKEIMINFKFFMTTNGVLLNRYMDFLYKNDFSLTISLDGDKYSNSYRVFNDKTESFDIVFNNVFNLQKKYPTYFKNNVFFNAVLHDRNDYKGVFKFIKNNFNKKVRASPVNPLISNNRFITETTEYDFTKQEDLECFLKSGETSHYNIFLKNYTNYHFNDYDDVFYYDRKKLYYPTGTCLPFSRRLFVTANGKILPCETIDHKYALGVVKNEKVTIDINKISNQYNFFFQAIKKRCANCYRVKFCTKCLFLNIINENGKLKCDFLNNEGHSNLLSRFYGFFEKHPDFYTKIWKETRYV